MAGGMLCNRFRGAYHHDLAALITAIRTQINNPVGTADHIEVVFDHQDCRQILGPAGVAMGEVIAVGELAS